MKKAEILEKVNELIAAPSVCADVKKAAQDYLKAQDAKTADVLIDALEANVNSIGETIAFAESDMGRKIFGEEQAAKMVELGRKKKAEGEKYCFCPACQAGGVIYENRELLA